MPNPTRNNIRAGQFVLFPLVNCVANAGGNRTDYKLRFNQLYQYQKESMIINK